MLTTMKCTAMLNTRYGTEILNTIFSNNNNNIKIITTLLSNILNK